MAQQNVLDLEKKNVWWFLFERELAAWAQKGQVLSFWWRDDDALGTSPQLDRLLALAERHGIPLTLALIPNDNCRLLANRLRNLPAITVVQHGIDHINRAEATEKGSRGCASSWDAQEIASRIVKSQAFLQMENAIPVFVPTWNATHPALETALRMTGMSGWSAFGGMTMTKSNLKRIDTHLEPLRWKGGARFTGEARFLRRVRRLCQERRRTGLWQEPVGLLTHHLQHDEGSYRQSHIHSTGHCAADQPLRQADHDKATMLGHKWVKPSAFGLLSGRTTRFRRIASIVFVRAVIGRELLPFPCSVPGSAVWKLPEKHRTLRHICTSLFDRLEQPAQC
jgi:hypothetical protein